MLRKIAIVLTAVALFAGLSVSAAAPASALNIGQCTTNSNSYGYGTLCRTSTYGFRMTVDDTRSDGYCVVGRTLENASTISSCGAAVSRNYTDTTDSLFNYGAEIWGNGGTGMNREFTLVTIGATEGCGGGCSRNAYYTN